MSNTPNLQAIPTNIISGFLGSGKTTTILSLLKNKPNTERWAVLVNEFGEIGIDGTLFTGQQTQSDGVFIREVPGGCMCCSVGVPMQVALNQLLKQAKPHRLLIEPTGLGHPKGVLEVLCSSHYRDVLDIQKTITLVDARNLADARYTNHDTFNQQIDIADIIVGNKADLYQNNEQAQLEHYIAARKGSNTPIILADHGKLDPALLQQPSTITPLQYQTKHTHHHHHATSNDDEAIPACGYLKKENAGEGFLCIGWRFCPKKVFSYNKLNNWLNQVSAERIKATLITDQGPIGYNQAGDSLKQSKLDDSQESRLEIICTQINQEWESQLLDCLASNL